MFFKLFVFVKFWLIDFYCIFYEKGFTIDAGFRGNFNNYFSFDVNIFRVFYNERINIYTRADGKAERDNIGDARILGIESLIDFNVKKTLEMNSNYVFNYFSNLPFITSEYTKSEKLGLLAIS